MANQKMQVYKCGMCGNTVEVLEAGEGTLTCCDKPMTLVASQKSNTEPHVILGIHVSDRAHHAPGVQTVLTEYGANIKTRLGLHEVHGGTCSPNGLILLEFIGDDDRFRKLADGLSKVEGVEVKRMVFEHV